MRTLPRWLVAAGAAAAVCGLSATPALAKKTKVPPPTQPAWSTFSDCPTSVANLTDCVYASTTSGSFTIGNTTVTVGSTPIIFQGGIITGASDTFVPAADGNTLSQVPLTVPGGLLSLTPPDLFPQPLQGILEAAINAVNGVTATAELVGNPTFSFENFLTGAGPTATLPVEIQLSNPFLGNSCFIGSASDPVTLNLTTGKTHPPAGVTALKGRHGKLGFFDNGNVVAANGDSIVDNAFAVPGATGCGGIFSALIDPVVNLKTGIPAAAGTNSAILKGTSDLASAASVIANGG
ncbi:MAG TPA: hypothetical protein VGL69_15195 [Solirubrobacteraceae bacterium]